MGKGYYVGLDMGTGSVGWAVTDESYQILRRHGKAMWGVRLFESAKTAEERRMFRTGRRRLDRRGWRIEILQEIFAEEISRVDPGFFLRMKESKYYPEDKRDIQGNCPELPYTLFVDKTFTDKDFHKKYPTIYHLRKMLMETEDTPDIRLVYLALHHMMKHRGHFLLSGDISQVTEFKNTFNQFIENIRNEGMDFEIELDESAVQMIEETLKDKNLTRSAKKAKLVKGLNAKNVRDKAFLTLLSGGTVKLSDLFGMEELNEGERPKISFADNRYEEYAAVVEMELGELYYIVESAKAVYDWAILSDILGGSTSVSDAKVRAYEKHKADLKYLKAVVKEYFPKEVYNAVFVESSDKLNNYPAYIGMTKKNGKKVSLEGKRCSREEFMDFLKKNIVVKLPDEETKMYLQSELEKDSFLPKQVNKDNGVIPYQVHKYELKKILDNLGDKIPFLKENAEKIEKLFSFRIPYYVGPLRTGNGENSKFAWAERKSTEKIYPWNFENVIDVEQSAENFIRRMTNKCTYLIGEDVLPKDSLLYSKFMVLNELNNLRLDGQKISVELKQKIYRDVFCRSRKVTQKKLKSYLIREGIAGKNVELTGIDGDFKGSLTAYHDFKEKLTGVELTQKEKEEIILNIVLFGDDKKLLKQRLKKKFPQLTEKQINFEVIETSQKIIDYAQEKLNVKFNVNLLMSLSDHINFALIQYRQGNHVPKLVNEEVKRFYKEEYHIGEIAVQMINERFQILFPKDEATAIAFHLITATENKSNHQMMIIMKAVSDIVKIVEDYLNVSLHEDTIAYSRFVIHLKFLFKTVLSKQNVPEVAGMDFIFTQIKSEYKNVIECVKKIADYIMEKFNYRCTDGDCIYLMLHVVRLYETTLN